MKKHTLSVIIFLFVSQIILAGCIPHIGEGGPVLSTKGDFVHGAFATGFPPLPVYKNSKVVESFASQDGFGAILISGDGLSKVINFYDQSFTPLGWDSTFHKTSDTSYWYDIKNKNYTGQVIINTASDGKQTAITLSVASR